MIKKIEKLSLKSFHNYSGPEKEFNLKNIIFGYNGKGKSALANGIYNQCLRTSDISQQNVRFFNSNYAKDSLLLNPSNSKIIKGVIATFGIKDVESEKKIQELNKQIVDTTTLSKSIDDLKQKLMKECDDILDREKGEAKINKKKAQPNITDYMSQYQKDLDTALTNVTEEELKATHNADALEAKYANMMDFKFVQMDAFSSDEIEKISKILTKSYSDEQIPSSQVIAWLKEGINIHTEKKADRCEFCGAPIILDDIIHRVDDYLDNEKQKDVLFLGQIINRSKTNIELNIKDNKALFETIFNESSDEYYNPINKYIDILKKLIDILDSKVKNMETPFTFDFTELLDSITAYNAIYSKFDNMKAKKISDLQNNLSKANDMLKGYIAYMVLNDSLIASDKSNIISKETKLDKDKNNNLQIQSEIDLLKESKQPTTDFAIFISELLKDLEIDIKLDIVGKDYVLESPSSNTDLLIDDISEGEKNLLSLLFFYFEMFSDNEQKHFKETIKIIIVDDPISSMDDINKMFVLSLIKNIIDIPSPQVFVFTHVWEDFVDLCYKKDDKDNYAFFEICKNEKGSFVVSANAKETPYEHDFVEIYNFSKKEDANNLSECETYHYPNIIRKVLEKFMGFKVKNNSATRGNISNVTIALCNMKGPSNKDKVEIPILLDVCNIYSHKSTSNPKEILQAAKFLISKIQLADPAHFAMMENLAKSKRA